jgi:hypothetical protein
MSNEKAQDFLKRFQYKRITSSICRHESFTPIGLTTEGSTHIIGRSDCFDNVIYHGDDLDADWMSVNGKGDNDE